MIQQITDKIVKHHELYRFPVKAELWEDIFDSVINGGGKRWNMGSHKVGPDVTSPEGIRYQLKSGMVDIEKDIIQWSGHRTTKHKTIQEKVEFISKKHCDKYAMLARDKTDWERHEQKYYLLIFDAKFIDYSKLPWSEFVDIKDGKVAGWEGKDDTLQYSAKISRSMSDQLWTTAKLSYLGNPVCIVVPPKDTEFFTYNL